MEIYAPSKNENVSPRQNIFELIVDMRLSNLEPLKGESESLKQMFDLIDDENLPSNESPHNTFLPVGFQITKETLGYLDRNYGKNCTKNYHQDLDSSIIKRKRNGNEEIEEEEDTDDDANGTQFDFCLDEEEKGVEEEGAEEECSGGGGTVSVVKYKSNRTKPNRTDGVDLV
ncbi:hypothetical protein RirG_100830 [Rhizophagus irregularis DAOM 197198w]|uniref:Uncharacterized protein n=1 Tax=Rhizophagus irregularis (strain DAOM 197198w) TaxID=1432141 RepID=A0A015KMZ2_RHIIW|nr:hypothetical protein RirG_100830 [Rhizophagus irregularis DAOM 197198w]